MTNTDPASDPFSTDTRAVGYQVHVPSFADSDADGVGDLVGLTTHLGYLELLGITDIELTGVPAALHPDPAGAPPQSDGADESGVSPVQQLTHHAAARELTLHWHIRAEPGVLHQIPFSAAPMQAAIDKALRDLPDDAPAPRWEISGPAGGRAATRLGDGDIALGGARTRALLLVLLAVPGVPTLLYGDELGLPDGPGGLPGAATMTMPWEGDAPPFGFTGSVAPQADRPTDGTDPAVRMAPDTFRDYVVEDQLDDQDSTLNLVRTAIELRATHPAFSGSEISWYGAPRDCLAFRRDGGGLVCAVNAGDTPIELPPGEVLLSSAPLVDGMLPADATAWLLP
ncbi:DUF3459 domain-containing protein [Nakamurella sp. DB0629]|uniref:DUF3459 domain-containing protein n=1 Tax=Nakamurella aerolata TaxID=1656892 RepID=A0A849AD71_9ACTN|nr:DUF3459 domain-containing protein [Nakamurella aerolata]